MRFIFRLNCLIRISPRKYEETLFSLKDLKQEKKSLKNSIKKDYLIESYDGPESISQV